MIKDIHNQSQTPIGSDKLKNINICKSGILFFTIQNQLVFTDLRYNVFYNLLKLQPDIIMIVKKTWGN